MSRAGERHRSVIGVNRPADEEDGQKKAAPKS
jgi:hypothetical protein